MNKINFVIILAVVSCGIFGINSVTVVSKTSRDGKHYFDQMKASMLEILEEHQQLINTTPDGSVKSEKLTSEAFYKKAYATFKKIAGKGFKLKNLEGETNPEKIAPILTALLQGGRVAIANLQKNINAEPDGSVKLKKFIPAVFGRIMIARFTEKTGVAMKQTSLSRENYSVRNPYNAPNEWETKALKKFQDSAWELNQGVGATAEKQYRYVKPIYIKKGCLVCHGIPSGETGLYGHPKEGYQVGDIRGGISIALPNN